jgi:hypothetical protein
MKHLFTSSLLAMSALAMVAAAPAFGQAKSSFTAPKHPWEGHADLSGIWEAKATAGDDVSKLIVDPPNKKIPYLPAAAVQAKANAKNKAGDSTAKCWMPGVPRLMYMNKPFQIFQTAKYIMIDSEYAHVYRQVFMDGSAHLDGVQFWDGDSRGHWEGDTLVVDVTDFNDQTWFDKAGNYHSDQLHVVERYTRTGPDTLTYEATITDPKVFSKPWKISVPMMLNKAPNARLMEYECQELAPLSASEAQKKK